jgi:hypothetical protein
VPPDESQHVATFDPVHETQAEVPADQAYPAEAGITGHEAVTAVQALQAVPAVFGVYPWAQAAQVAVEVAAKTNE